MYEAECSRGNIVNLKKDLGVIILQLLSTLAERVAIYTQGGQLFFKES